MGDERSALFDAVLEPHRSLGKTGFTILMVAIAAVGFMAGICFLLAGAWPVFGFFGLDVVLIYIAFKANYRSARMYETLLLTEDSLNVERVGPGRAHGSWQFQPYWLRIEMDDPPEHASQLTLASHGKRLVIGKFLTPEERLEVARALRAALAGLKEPQPPPAAPVTG